MTAVPSRWHDRRRSVLLHLLPSSRNEQGHRGGRRSRHGFFTRQCHSCAKPSRKEPQHWRRLLILIFILIFLVVLDSEMCPWSTVGGSGVELKGIVEGDTLHAPWEGYSMSRESPDERPADLARVTHLHSSLSSWSRPSCSC